MNQQGKIQQQGKEVKMRAHKAEALYDSFEAKMLILKTSKPVKCHYHISESLRHVPE